MTNDAKPNLRADAIELALDNLRDGLPLSLDTIAVARAELAALKAAAKDNFLDSEWGGDNELPDGGEPRRAVQENPKVSIAGPSAEMPTPPNPSTAKGARELASRIIELVGPVIGSLMVVRNDLENYGDGLDQGDGFDLGKNAASAMFGEGTRETEWCEEAKELLKLLADALAAAHAQGAGERTQQVIDKLIETIDVHSKVADGLRNVATIAGMSLDEKAWNWHINTRFALKGFLEVVRNLTGPQPTQDWLGEHDASLRSKFVDSVLAIIAGAEPVCANEGVIAEAVSRELVKAEAKAYRRVADDYRHFVTTQTRVSAEYLIQTLETWAEAAASKTKK